MLMLDMQTVLEKINSSLEIPSYSEYCRGFDAGLRYVLDLIESAASNTAKETEEISN